MTGEVFLVTGIEDLVTGMGGIVGRFGLLVVKVQLFVTIEVEVETFFFYRYMLGSWIYMVRRFVMKFTIKNYEHDKENTWIQ